MEDELSLAKNLLAVRRQASNGLKHSDYLISE